MSTTSKLLGVVLCGGESRRMGRDKGLLQTAGRPWALRMGDKLAQQRLPVIYSINKTQIAAYSALLPPDSHVIDEGEREGPLAGLLSVHHRFPAAHLLVVACDMQDLDAPAIGNLIAAWRAGGADSYAYEVEGFLQPFCAIYTSFSHPGTIASPSALLRSGSLHKLQGEAAAFRNYNTL
jgi:molybdopterin-guanine dinucleotide biosynthesis protein A